VKTINREGALQSLRRERYLIASIVRRDLQLNDEEGTDYLPNATIFEELTRILGVVPGARHMGDIIAQTRFENVSKTSMDSLLANTKDCSVLRITSLKLRVKKLEKKGGSRTHKLKRLYKVGRSARVISFDEASLGDQEDASKQGRKIDDIDKDAEISWSWGKKKKTPLFFFRAGMVMKNVDKVMLDDGEVFARQSTIALCIEISTTSPTKTVIADDLTIAQTLIWIRNKGKGIMVEEPVKMKKKDQISIDEELAFKLQAEEEEERLAREKAQREEEANIISWDNLKAMIDADYQMA
ncbi:hypothetical protein Tco_1438010, partial [Tanacetum coccineum]